MKTFYLALASFFISSCLFAQVYLKDIDAVTQHAGSVMEQLQNKNIEKAYDLLNKYWIMSDNYLYELQLLEVDEFNLCIEHLGKVIDSELIEKEQIKDCLIKMEYLLKLENGGIYIKIGYYKNSYGWVVSFFDTTDNLDEIFKNK